MLGNSVFTDEKNFTIEAKFNHQNDLVQGCDLPAHRDHFSPHRQKPASVMVLAPVSRDTKSPLVFVEPGVKVNSKYYVENILETVMLPWVQQEFGERNWMFIQDGAPSLTPAE